MEDFYLPVRGNDSGTEITNLDGLEYAPIEDIDYLKNKMFASYVFSSFHDADFFPKVINCTGKENYCMFKYGYDLNLITQKILKLKKKITHYRVIKQGGTY